MKLLIDIEESDYQFITDCSLANYSVTEKLYNSVNSGKRITTGRWIRHGTDEGFILPKYDCSECHYYAGSNITDYNFCPKCGADMRE